MKTFKVENEPKIETGFITPEFWKFFNQNDGAITKQRTKVISIFKKEKYIYAGSCCFSACFDDPILNPSTENSKILML
jgi:hypothetical protein